MSLWVLVLALLAPVPSTMPNTGMAAAQVQVYELAPQPPPPPTIKARAALLVDLDTGSSIYERESHRPLAPASLTKVMTALVALDALPLDRLVSVPPSINQLPWDSTRMGLKVGEQVTVRELLDGLFLNSGNDAAIALSEATTSRAAFVERMNARARALGMSDTHFVNPIGLDDPGHVTSAADLARAAKELEARYPAVAAIASAPAMTLAATPTHHAYGLYNLNQLIRTYPGATGLKTGWTGHAGGCLIATASRDGRHLMVVVLGSPSVFKEAAQLLDYGFMTPAV